MDNQQTILSTSNLSVGYRHSKRIDTVLNDINVELKQGQLVCFMGPNGVGKSTLIRTLIGAQKALGGQVYINNIAIANFSAQEMAKQISVVLTDKINAGNMSVRELVALGRYPHVGWNIAYTKHDEAKIEGAIEATKIEALSSRKIFELSDGQLQKAMIARALCQDTPIMVLDEPTAHLDLNNRVEVINLLSDLAKNQDKTILMATHELDLALQSADRIWLAGAQQPLIDGFPEDLVLNGKIDDVFGLKGFDLKTGRLEKKLGKGAVGLKGEGYQYLWTKNALERHGIAVENEAAIEIEILDNEPIQWIIKNKGEHKVFTLENLINQVKLSFVE